VPIGRLYLHESAAEVRVMDIAVLPEWRGQGLGTTLLHAVLDAGREGNARVSLHVEPGNPAQRLYARLGFRLVEHRGVYDFLEWVAPRRLDALTAGDFEAAADGGFTLRYEAGEPMTLRVESVSHRPAARPHGREGFSVVFTGAASPVMPQRIYRVEHDALGVMELFLVPIGLGPSGVRYEAVFG
jgi:Acetyltransferase (GNAT) family